MPRRPNAHSRPARRSPFATSPGVRGRALLVRYESKLGQIEVSMRELVGQNRILKDELRRWTTDASSPSAHLPPRLGKGEWEGGVVESLGERRRGEARHAWGSRTSFGGAGGTEDESGEEEEAGGVDAGGGGDSGPGSYGGRFESRRSAGAGCGDGGLGGGGGTHLRSRARLEAAKSSLSLSVSSNQQVAVCSE